MLDFTEQALLTESQPELSADTPTVSDSLPVTNPVHGGKVCDTLADPETTAATLKALAPWLEDAPLVQDATEPTEVT